MSISRAEARDAAKHPTVHRTPESPNQNIGTAELGGPCFRALLLRGCHRLAALANSTPSPQSLSKPQALLQQPVLLHQEDWPRAGGTQQCPGTRQLSQGTSCVQAREAAKHLMPRWPPTARTQPLTAVGTTQGWAVGGWDQPLWGPRTHTYLESFISICCRISCRSSSVLWGKMFRSSSSCLLGRFLSFTARSSFLHFLGRVPGRRGDEMTGVRRCRLPEETLPTPTAGETLLQSQGGESGSYGAPQRTAGTALPFMKPPRPTPSVGRAPILHAGLH